jgi:hypothetical protein
MIFGEHELLDANGQPLHDSDEDRLGMVHEDLHEYEGPLHDDTDLPPGYEKKQSFIQRSTEMFSRHISGLVSNVSGVFSFDTGANQNRSEYDRVELSGIPERKTNRKKKKNGRASKQVLVNRNFQDSSSESDNSEFSADENHLSLTQPTQPAALDLQHNLFQDSSAESDNSEFSSDEDLRRPTGGKGLNFKTHNPEDL